MKSIVILSDRHESDSTLITLLNVVFPDCEIRVIAPPPRPSRKPHSAPRPGRGPLLKKDNDYGQYSNYR